MATVFLFVFSLLAASVLVVVKAIEIKYGKKNLILNILSKLDSKVESFVLNLKFRILQIVQSVRYVVLVRAKEVCKNFLVKIEQKIMDEYKSRQSTIMMGRKDIANRGSVSFYLKKITEDKCNGQKGKIEQSL